MNASELIPDDWYENLLDEWQEKLALKGFDDVKILFTGFSSQGDGACFTATVKKDFLALMPEELKASLIADAVSFRLSHGKPPRWWPMENWCWSAALKHTGRYYHENCMHLAMEVDVDPSEAFWRWFDQYQKDLLEEVQSLARDIYRDLETAYWKEYKYAEKEAERSRRSRGGRRCSRLH